MANCTPYNVDKNYAGVSGFGRNWSNTKFSGLLAANTVASVTVPSTSAAGYAGATINKYYAIIRASTTTFVAINETVAVPIAPVGNVLNVSTASLLPPDGDCFQVKAGDVMQFISAGTPYVTVEFYIIQN